MRPQKAINHTSPSHPDPVCRRVFDLKIDRLHDVPWLQCLRQHGCGNACWPFVLNEQFAHHSSLAGKPVWIESLIVSASHKRVALHPNRVPAVLVLVSGSTFLGKGSPCGCLVLFGVSDELHIGLDPESRQHVEPPDSDLSRSERGPVQ